LWFAQTIFRCWHAKKKSTCASLNVMVMQNPSKFQRMSVTGVVASKCARHNMFFYKSVADLYAGERWAIIPILNCENILIKV
jgi:hypothetical protein